MSNRRIPADRSKRKTKKSSQTPRSTDYGSSGNSHATAKSKQSADLEAENGAADSEPGSALPSAKQEPRDRTFSFRDSFGHEEGMLEKTVAPAAHGQGDQRSTKDGRPKSKGKRQSLAKQGSSTSKPSLLPRQADPYPVGPQDDTPEHVVRNGQGEDVPIVANIVRDGAIESVPELMKILKDDRGPLVPRYVREITGNGDQAIVLAQILYWFDLSKKKKVRTTRRRNDRVWAYNTHRDLGKEVGMQAQQVGRVLQALKKKGFIETGVFKVNGHPTTHYRPILQAILKAIVQAEQCRD